MAAITEDSFRRDQDGFGDGIGAWPALCRAGGGECLCLQLSGGGCAVPSGDSQEWQRKRLSLGHAPKRKIVEGRGPIGTSYETLGARSCFKPQGLYGEQERPAA